MSIYEVFIERPIGKDDLADEVSTRFQIELGQVEVVEDIESSKGNGLVTIERKMIGGEFATSISVFVKPDVSNMPESQFASYLSENLSCGVLISDDSPNPYRFKYVALEGTIKRVLLENEPFDERGEVIIIKTPNQGNNQQV